MEDQKLLETAENARNFAYAPYSRFRVGAALLGRSGRVYTGCNIENASYGVTICAERVALFKAISEGEREFTRIAIVSDADPTYPCGSCRQALWEFMPEGTVVSRDAEKGVVRVRLAELLPRAFTLKGE